LKKSLAAKLNEVKSENEGLKHDLDTLQTLCMENDERVQYYQQMETRLQECMNGAMLQVGLFIIILLSFNVKISAGL